MLIVPLALTGAGFDLSSRHIAGLAAWLVVVLLLVFGASSRTLIARPLYWGCGLIGGLALLSALSSLWSGSLELGVTEADRVLVYLGFFLAAFLIAQTSERRQRFAEGMLIAVTTVILLGLLSRLLPHVLVVDQGLGSGPRLRYPLGYWNANGALCAIGFALQVWASRRSDWAALRWISVALAPATLLCLYFTYSRGAVLSLLVGLAVILVLSRDRLWLLATAAVGVLGAIPAVIAVQSETAIAENQDVAAATGQGVTVLLILLAGTALALLLFAGLRRLEDRAGPRTGRALSASQNPVLLKRLAIVAAVVAVGLAIAIGGRAWDRFSTGDVQFPETARSHFSELNGAGRDEFWRVALDGLDEEPVLGQGAGTYQFTWDQQRKIDIPVHDAHSLFLQTFDELGIVGGVLVLALVGSLLWFGFAAWRAASGAQRDLCAVMLAVMAAFVVGAAIDWFWQIAALGALFFLAAGVVVAVRCSQLASPLDERSRTDTRRTVLTVCGLVVAWITAVALIGPLLVDREIKASQDAAAAGDIASAVSHAETARSIEPWAASPYVQLALLAELQDDYAGGAARMTQAIEREADNWELYYLRSRMRGENGDLTPSAVDFIRASELNPRAAEIQAVNKIRENELKAIEAEEAKEREG